MLWYRTILLAAVAAEEHLDALLGVDPVLLSEAVGGIRDLFSSNSGEGTYFGANGDSRGACEDWRTSGQTVPSGALRVAMNSAQWFGGKSCGACLEVTSSAMGYNKAFAVVTDLCPECKAGDLDFAVNGDGRHHVTWKAVPCDHDSFEYIMQGSNEWYVKVAVRGAVVPVKSVAAKSGGSWKQGSAVSGGFYELTGSRFSFPLEVRLTSYSDEVVTDTISGLRNDALVKGSSQFAEGAGPSPTPARTPAPTPARTPAPTPEPDGGGGDEAMTPMTFGSKLLDKFRCSGPPAWGNLGSHLSPAACAAACLASAACGGAIQRPRYGDGTGPCTSFASCDASVPTKQLKFHCWRKDKGGAGPSPTPPPTPATPVTPAPTPGAAALCRPWCHTHPYPHWHGDKGAKCLWKRCTGCPECADYHAMDFESDGAVSSSHPPQHPESEEELDAEADAQEAEELSAQNETQGAAGGVALAWLLFHLA